MGTITTKDGTEIFYKDWGSGQPVVFSHGWPLNADAWDDQLFLVASRGYRAIAHDRRGGGRSGQSWDGNNLDTYADDLADLMQALDLHDAVLVGHSTGGGEVTRYIGRHGTSRVAKAVLLAAIPPLMLKTDAIRPGSRSRSSTPSATASSPTGPSSTRTSACPSTAPTGPAPPSPRACATGSGRCACKSE
jgi:pimeloyl-ACP methyl ester carboxylesterase